MNILIVIPARSGSKGVPNKNIKDMNGKPLISYVINTIQKSKLNPRIIVSTDSEKIANVALEQGAEVPFIRNSELATDTVPIPHVIQDAMLYMDSNGYKADIIMSLQPTSPLLSIASIDSALEKIMSNPEIDSVISVAKIRHCHPFRSYKVEDSDKLLPLTEYTTEKFLQKQDRPDAYGFTGGFYIRRRHCLEGDMQGFALGDNVYAQVVPDKESIDIDDEIDFVLAEILLKNNAVEVTAD